MASTDKADAFAETLVLLVKAALAPIQERLAAAEAKAARADVLEQALTDMRERVVTLETKSGSLQIPDLTDVRDRLLRIESTELDARLKALEAKPEPVALELKEDTGLREKLAVLETQITEAKASFDANVKAGMQPFVERMVERVSTLEARAAVPGPAGANGIDGKDGKDGVDGLGFDDVTAEFDGDRTLVLKFARENRVKTFPVTLPFQRYQGVFIDGKSYTPGDVVTFGGSAWHCNAETGAKPGDGSKDWQLCVKRGRDGKDGTNGRDAGLPVVKAG